MDGKLDEEFVQEEPLAAVEAAGAVVGKSAAGTEVDGASAEAFIAEKRIGERIKRLRLKKSMGLVELGRQTGLSASFLSQLETGRVVPTLRNLARVALVFGKDLSYFFEAESQAMFRIHRKSERTRQPQSGVDEPSYFFESLGYGVPDRQFDPYLAEFVPQKNAGEMRAHVHPGAEFLYVISGELEIEHAGKLHLLSGGDGVYFDASVPHAYRCHGSESTQVIIVSMHQQLGQNSALTRSVGLAGGVGRGAGALRSAVQAGPALGADAKPRRRPSA
jgi:transcriptional regulator with XRE-family HTH domain